MEVEMKLCKECRYYRFEPGNLYLLHQCLREIDLVTGEQATISAYKAREEDGTCGTNGVRWDPKA
jgi:hypothetical protein